MRGDRFEKLIRMPTRDVVESFQQKIGRETVKRPLHLVRDRVPHFYDLGFEQMKNMQGWVLALRNHLGAQVFGGAQAEKLPFSALVGAYSQIGIPEEFHDLSARVEQGILSGRFQMSSVMRTRA